MVFELYLLHSFAVMYQLDLQYGICSQNICNGVLIVSAI